MLFDAVVKGVGVNPGIRFLRGENIQAGRLAGSWSLARRGFNPGIASGTATYIYDANGNMTYDPYKDLSLLYNHLNLPKQMTIPVGTGGAERNIYLLYDHAGKKLRKTVNDQGTVVYTQDYVNGLEYRTTGSGGALTLEAVYHDEGRITPNGTNYQ